MRRQARLPIHLKYGQKPDLVAPPFPLSSKTGLILTAYIMYTVMKSIVMKDSLLFFTVTQVKGVEPISYVREPKLPHTIFVCVMFNGTCLHYDFLLLSVGPVQQRGEYCFLVGADRITNCRLTFVFLHISPGQGVGLTDGGGGEG